MAGQKGIKAGKAYVEVYADNNRLSRGLKAASMKLKAFGASVTAVGSKLARIGTVMALPLVGASKVFADFETQMANVSTMLDNPEKSLAGFTRAVRDMAIEFGESTEALAGGLYDILSASIDSADALGVLEVAVKAAKGGMTDTAIAADAITTMINAYSLSAKDAADVSDLLFSIVKRGKTTFAELAPNIGKVATIAASAGVSLEELGAALSVMTRSGVQTENAITALQAIITSFLKPMSDSVSLARDLGFEMSAAAIKSEGLAGIFEKIGNLPPDAVAKLFPNVRALRGVLPALRNMTGFLGDIEVMGSRTGAAETAFEKMAKTLSVSYGKAKESVLGVASAVGESLAKSLKSASEKIVAVSKASASWIRKNQGVIISIAKIVTGLVVAGVALIAFGGIVSGIGAALGLLATGIGVLKVALLALTTPIGLVAAGVVLMATGIISATNSSGEAVDWLGDKFSSLKDRAAIAYAGIADALTKGDVVLAAKIFWSEIKLEWKIGTQAISELWEDMIHGVTVGWIEMTAFLSSTWASFISRHKVSTEKLAGFMTKAWFKIQSIFDDSIDMEFVTKYIEEEQAEKFKSIGKELEISLGKIETKRDSLRKAADEKHLQELKKIESEIKVAKEKLSALLVLTAKDVAAGEFRSQAEIESELWGKAFEVAEQMFPSKIADALGTALGTSIEKISIAGTFNPMAAFGLGGGNAMDRTAVATEKTAQNTAKILNEAKYNGPAFS